MESIRFYYDQNWTMQVLGDQGEPYLFYLEAGKSEIRMEVTLGDLAPLVSRMQNAMYALNENYRKILMIA